jgi:ABC-type transport system involved in multi-copper enzyme maturation permease subunit
MDGLRRFGAILRADLLERMRSPRFWIVLGVVAVLAWGCFPPATSDHLTVAVGDRFRGRYSSAWIGMILALEFSTLLSLAGFYLVRGTLTRDIDTRVWQLLVATPMTRRSYLLAKWCSHMAVLGLIVLAGLLVGIAAQLVRGEDLSIDLIELVKPVLLLSLPALALTAMFAIWFDLLPWLRKTAGNVLFFVVWMVMLTAPLSGLDPNDNPGQRNATMSDPGGVAVLMRELDRTVEPGLIAAKNRGLSIGWAAVGAQDMHKSPGLFDWSRWNVRAADLPARAFWLALAIAGILLAAPLLDRCAARAGTSASRTGSSSGRRLRWLDRLLAPLQRNPLGTLVAAELQLVLRARRRLWWLVLSVLLVIQLFAPPQNAAIAIIGAWLLSLDAFARAALRERDTGTAAFVFSAAKSNRRVLLARWIMLLVLAWLPVLPALLRFGFTAPSTALAIIAIGASFATWGLALSALVRNQRLFEMLAMCLAYVSVQGLPVLNAVATPLPTALWHLALLPVALLVLLPMWPRLQRA